MRERFLFAAGLTGNTSLLCISLFMIGCFGSFAQSKWEKITEGNHVHEVSFLSLVFFDTKSGYAITPLSLQRTRDGGKSWEKLFQTEPAENSFYSLVFTSNTTGYVVGLKRTKEAYEPLILRTSDAGKSWQERGVSYSRPLKSEVVPQLNGISFCNQDVGWTVGSDIILRTLDGGQTWEMQRVGAAGESLFGVQCVTPEQAWAVGRDGVILYTKDGGRNWNKQQSGSKGDLLRVRYYNGQGWIVGNQGERGVLLRTRDGGMSWQSQPLDTAETLFDIYVSEKVGWIVGSNGTILQTVNGGETWNRVESPTKNDLTCVFFVTPNQGWAAGGKQTLLHFSE